MWQKSFEQTLRIRNGPDWGKNTTFVPTARFSDTLTYNNFIQFWYTEKQICWPLEPNFSKIVPFWNNFSHKIALSRFSTCNELAACRVKKIITWIMRKADYSHTCIHKVTLTDIKETRDIQVRSQRAILKMPKL